MPGDNVPELLSDEEELDTTEMQNVALRTKQGSFLPIMAVLETQKAKHVDGNLIIDHEQGLRLLHTAAFYGKIKAVRALVEKHGAKVAIPDYRGQTPLHIAALAGNIEVVVYLADKMDSKSIDLRDNGLMTPLMNCIISNSEHAFIYLYCKGKCSLNNIDMNGNTLLHLAAEHGATNIARILGHLYKSEVKEEINSSIEKIKEI